MSVGGSGGLNILRSATMPQESPPTIDVVAARHWAARPQTASPWLHEEVARRMAERLSWIQLPVQRWAHWEPVRTGLRSGALLAKSYPDAQCVRVTRGVDPLPPGESRPARRWWQRLGRRPAPASVEITVPEPADGSLQLIWANMLLHQEADPRELMKRWLRALAGGGFLMFSCLGPDTVRELRVLYADLGWPPPVQDFTDMHDLGDRLALMGFADPVVDMEHITLSFDSPARLLAELRELGRNLHSGRFAGLRTPRWRQRLEAALDERLRPSVGAPLVLTFEVIYGHALKPEPRQPGSSRAPITVHRLRGGQDQNSNAHSTP